METTKANSKIIYEEPTHEEKLRALKKSIIHWEKVAKRPETTSIGSQSCPLCALFLAEYCVGCPIAEKMGYDSSKYEYAVDYSGCKDTPFADFVPSRTKENALAEVVFLKNLYIEMLESPEHKSDKGGHPPKKEEWVDVTRQIDWRTVVILDDESLFYVEGWHENTLLCSWYASKGLIDESEDDYEVRIEDNTFRILKKQ